MQVTTRHDWKKMMAGKIARHFCFAGPFSD
jgi:hypothetical protein